MRRDEPAPRGIPASWIQNYYWATALFVVADLAFNANMRAAALPRADLRYGYYALCFGCGFACRKWPRAAAWIGMGESALNILLLILSIMLPILSLTDTMFTGGDTPELMSPGKLANFMFTGAVLYISFQRNQAEAAATSGWLRR
jgi:hypothetical protein